MESVLIQKARSHNIMNNKAEYNRCALPRLTTKLGERDLEKWREEDRLEHLREATIEEKIRLRKKERQKKRGEANRRRDKEQPARKKRKMEEQHAPMQQRQRTNNKGKRLSKQQHQ